MRLHFPMQALLFVILIGGIAWAEDIDSEILKDLEFFSDLEIIETDAMLEVVRKPPPETQGVVQSQKKGSAK